MITFTEVKSRIVENHWDPQAVDTIDPALPNLGPASLNYIYNRSDELSGKFTISFAQFVAHLPTWQAQIQNDDEDGLTGELLEVLRSGNLTSINLASAFISDVHNNKALNGKISPHFNRTLFFFQMAVFESLPSAEVAMALSLHAVDLAMVFDLEEELRRYAYYKSYETDSRELSMFRSAIENSVQPIAGHAFKDIISDFQNYSASMAAKSSSYAVVQYITASPAAKNFSKNDATLITRLLGAYTWLLERRYAEKEVLQYEEGRELIIEKLPELIVSPPQEVLGSYEVEMQAPEIYPESGIFTEQVEGPGEGVQGVQQPGEKPLAQPSMVQKKLMADIAAHAPTNMRYNNQGANIRDLINKKVSEPRGGLVLERETNIKIDDEVKRLKLDRAKPETPDIQNKLEELRKRHQNNA